VLLCTLLANLLLPALINKYWKAVLNTDLTHLASHNVSIIASSVTQQELASIFVYFQVQASFIAF
jgi:hypothetical protein